MEITWTGINWIGNSMGIYLSEIENVEYLDKKISGISLFLNYSNLKSFEK